MRCVPIRAAPRVQQRFKAECKGVRRGAGDGLLQGQSRASESQKARRNTPEAKKSEGAGRRREHRANAAHRKAYWQPATPPIQEHFRDWIRRCHQANREKAKGTMHAYYLAHKEEILAGPRPRASRRQSGETAKAQNAAWMKANAERSRMSRPPLSAANRDRQKAAASAWHKARAVRRGSEQLHATWWKRAAAETGQAKRECSCWRNASHEIMTPGVNQARARLHGRAPGSPDWRGRAGSPPCQRDRCAACRASLQGKGHRDHIVALVRGKLQTPPEPPVALLPACQRHSKAHARDQSKVSLCGHAGFCSSPLPQRSSRRALGYRRLGGSRVQQR